VKRLAIKSVCVPGFIFFLKAIVADIFFVIYFNKEFSKYMPQIDGGKKGEGDDHR
jgi:hypothetical protein